MNKKTSIVAASTIWMACLIAAAQPEVDSTRRNAIVKAIDEVAPSVVALNVVDIQTERVYDPLLDEFYRMFGIMGPPPQVRQRAVEGIGTGFFFDDRGYILTNYHVIQGADYGTAMLPDGRELEFEYVGGDERTDVAVLRAKGSRFPKVRFGDSNSLMVGEWVIAIGNPFGTMMRDPQPSVSVGVVSAMHRRVSRDVGGGDRLYQNMIQTDAAINPGNSGGPLVNAAGEVIGINTMIFSNTGGYQGLGFAIPINRARRVAEEILENGRRRDPWLGFHGESVRNLTEYSLQRMGVTAQDGVLVTDILKGSPAYDAGLRLGDVIFEINGEPVFYPSDIDYVTWDMFVGDPVMLRVDRQGRQEKISFKVKELQTR